MTAPTDAGSRLAQENDEIRDRGRSLPWWRRPRELRRQLAWALVGTALASVVLVGGLNFVAARQLLDTGTKEQLVGIGQARARRIETGVNRVLGQVSAVSRDVAVGIALEELTAEYQALDDEQLTDEQLAAIEDFYQTNIVDRLNAIDLGQVGVADFVPTSNAARYLQYHYVVAPAGRGEDARSITDAGDGSSYSEAHAVHHEAMDSMATALGSGELVLVAANGDIVYSANKRVDIGTNLLTGPYADTEMGRVVTEALPEVRAGNAVIADLELYLPAGGKPVIFIAAAVQSGTEVVGALVVEIPIESVNAITTAGERWADVGLESGESYLVGPDLLLRSESRTWIEDPEGYLQTVEDEAGAGLIEALGSPVGVQIVDTAPVRAAQDGQEFEGTAENYLGTDTFSYAAPIDAPGVEWIVVVDIPLSDARAPLLDYATRLGIVLLIILPIAALIGLWLARRLTRPIAPVLDAATSIVAGERDPEIPDLGNDELGDLARRLGGMAVELGEREAELEEEFENRRELLLSVLPPRVVETTGPLIAAGELADRATAIAVLIDVSSPDLEDEDRQVEVLDEIADLTEQSSAGRAIERVRASADGYLHLAGAGTPDDGVDDAIEFALTLAARTEELRQREHTEIGLRIGISTGPIATGVLELGSLTFGAWGGPVRQAMAIVAMSQNDEILLDSSTAEALDPNRVRRSTDVVALDGHAMDLYTLDPTSLPTG